MNRLDQSRRDHQIAADTAAGASQALLARRYGVSERTVRRALVRVKRDDCGALERLADFDSRVNSAIEQLGIERMKARSPRTRVAAMHLQMNLMKERERLLIGPSGQTSPERDPQVRAEFAAGLIALAVVDGVDKDVLGWLEGVVARALAEGS